jgi:hypothetical protein
MTEVIAGYYLNNNVNIENLEEAKKYVNSFSSASGRAKEYLAIITASLSNSEKL